MNYQIEFALATLDRAKKVLESFRQTFDGYLDHAYIQTRLKTLEADVADAEKRVRELDNSSDQ